MGANHLPLFIKRKKKKQTNDEFARIKGWLSYPSIKKKDSLITKKEKEL